MIGGKRAILAAAALLFGIAQAAAQYYSWGSDAPMRWSTVRLGEATVILPDTAMRTGRAALFYANRIHGDVGYGFTHGPLRMPYVVHPENFEANGLTMFLPKRIELRTVPDPENYATPWIKHLVAHETRHAVQYNNLNRGLFRVLRIVAGEQSPTVALLCMPLWAMEGDAVLFETAISSFGRGLQPSFSMGYRAMERVGTDRSGTRYRSNPDKWFCGSYRDYIPDHYQLGYQLNAYAYERYGENIWDKIIARAVRRPYYFATTHTGLKKYYGTSVRQLFRDTFDALQAHWDSLPQPPESARPLVELPDDNYTTYRWPLPAGDSLLLAVKSDLGRSARFVLLDLATGREREVARCGLLSSRPVLQGQRVWWTEYRASKLFPERVNSQLCYLDLDAAKVRPHTVDSLRNVLYPAVEGAALFWAEHTPDGCYAVADTRGNRVELPFGTEIHGLAWDERTQARYALVTDDAGMWIARVERNGLHPVTEPTYSTLADLRSDNDGQLYFGSIFSGKDEAYRLDLMRASAPPMQLTESRYGAFAPAPLPGGKAAVVTVYDRKGYRPALQPLDSLRPAVWSELPENRVSLHAPHWPVVNLDTVQFTPDEQRRQEAAAPSRHYRKALHALHVHSWLPVAFDPYEAIDDHHIQPNFGATILSQNRLSNTDAFASYGWSRDEGSLLRAGLRYSGWGVRLGFYASYGGSPMVYRLSAPDPDSDGRRLQPLPKAETYYSFEAKASLPLLFQRGYHTRRLTLSAGWNFSNGQTADLGAIRYNAEGEIANLDEIGYRRGLHKLQFGISLSDQVLMAYRDFLPRFAWQLQANYAVNPANPDFSQLIAGYGHLYLPGFAPHHSIKLAAAGQTSVGGAKFAPGYHPLTYRASALIPTGFASSAIQADRYRAVGLDYQLPVAYPDGGIRSLLYVKRIRLNFGGQFARFRVPAGSRMALRDLWSVGGDLIFDCNFLRLPASGTTPVKLSVYRPSNGKWWFGGSVGLPF